MLQRIVVAARSAVSTLVVRRKGKETTIEKGQLPFGKLSLANDILRQHNVWDAWIFGDRDGAITFCGEIPERAKQKLRNVLVR